jgi:putative endonuclease
LAEHRAGVGARYTRGRGPLRIVGLWRLPTRTAALRLEYRLKQLPHALKHDLAGGRVLGEVVPRRNTARRAKTW